MKDPSISLWGPHQLPASPKQTFRKQQSPFSILDPTLHRCHADCSIQLVPCERPFNLTVGTSPVACKPKANFPETTIPVFNFRSNLHRCHADCSIQLVPCERPFNLTVGTSPVACKPKANFPETTIPVFNFRSNLHRCHFPETTIPIFNVRSNLHPTCTAVTQTVRSNLFPVKDPSISLWGPHQLPASPKQTFRKQQSPFSILDPTLAPLSRRLFDPTCSL